MADQYAPLPQYDALRNRLKSQFAQQKQETSDSIQRRFAANGMVGSGAYGKAQDEAERQVGNAEADANAQLGFQEAGEQQRQKEVAEGRAFQTSERTGAQGFASSERVAGQQFSKELADRDMAFKTMAFNEDSKQKWAQLDLAQKEYTSSQAANRTNEFTALGGVDDQKKYEQAMYRRYGANWRAFQ